MVGGPTIDRLQRASVTRDRTLSQDGPWFQVRILVGHQIH